MTAFKYAQLALVGAKATLEREREHLAKAPARHVPEHQKRVADAEKDVLACLSALKVTYTNTVE